MSKRCRSRWEEEEEEEGEEGDSWWFNWRFKLSDDRSSPASQTASEAVNKMTSGNNKVTLTRLSEWRWIVFVVDVIWIILNILRLWWSGRSIQWSPFNSAKWISPCVVPVAGTGWTLTQVYRWRTRRRTSRRGEKRCSSAQTQTWKR